MRRARDIGLALVLGSASPKIENRPPLSWNLSTLLIHNRGHLVRLGVLERFQLRGGLLSIFGEADPKTRVSPISSALLTGSQKGAIPGPESRVGEVEPRRGFHDL